MASSSSSTGKRGKLKKPYKTSAEWVAEDNDLMTDILLRLPVESIINCKLVSKQMRSLISSYLFARRFHELRHKEKKNNSFGLFIYKRPCYKASMYLSLNDTDENRNSRVRVPGNFPKEKIDILQSCNGLFLCGSGLYGRRKEEKKLFVCNATIKHSVLILAWSSDRELVRDRCLPAVGLAFDPLRSPEYKVVAIWYVRSGGYRAEIYSSADKSWRPAKGEAFRSYFGQNYNGVYHNGAIYWVQLCSQTILSFDLDEECLKPFELPRRPKYASTLYYYLEYFGSSGAHLQLIDHFDKQYLVYEMNTDVSEWQVKYVISTNDINLFSSSNDIRVVLDFYESSILSIAWGEAEDELALVIAFPDKIIHYSSKNKTTRLLRDKSSLGSRMFFKEFKNHMSTYHDVFQYHETIYPVT